MYNCTEDIKVKCLRIYRIYVQLYRRYKGKNKAFRKQDHLTRKTRFGRENLILFFLLFYNKGECMTSEEMDKNKCF